MRHGSLEDPIAKLQRAIEHYRLLKEALGGFDHQLVFLRIESSADGLRHQLYADTLAPLPEDLPLMLGDANHNLRSALDYLVYQLHERHFRGKIPPEVAEQTQFPIREQAPKSSTDKWQTIGNLGERERAAIAWLQPYNQRNDSLYGIREHLADIGAIDNVDKHRRLHLVRTVAQAVPSMASIPGYGLHQSPAFGVPIESGSLVDTWVFDRRPPDAMLSGIRNFRSAVVFDAAGHHIDMLPHLRGSIQAVALVIRRFSRLFPPLTTLVNVTDLRPSEPPFEPLRRLNRRAPLGPGLWPGPRSQARRGRLRAQGWVPKMLSAERFLRSG